MPDEFTLKVPLLAGVLIVVSLFVSRYFRVDPMVSSLLLLITPSLIDITLTCFHWQLDAIPTVGFSDPILSYFSALKFNLFRVRMLREGYQKVIRPSSICPFLVI